MNRYLLAGDVGGTKTDLGLYALDPGGSLQLVREAEFPSRHYDGLEQVVREFLDPEPPRIAAAAFGVAGPVVDRTSVATTNLPWRVEVERLAAAIGCKRLRLLNDLETTAYGTLFLAPGEFHTLQAGVERAGNRAVLAAGTGLGQAMLFWDGTRYHPSPSEGGHVDFAPRDATEMQLLEFLLRDSPRVSYEHLLSGPGLVRIFRFFDCVLRRPVAEGVRARMAREDPSAVISEAGLRGECPACAAALDLFVRLYGAQAGNLALTFLATGGVYVAGGIVTKILPHMTTGRFIEAFTAKPPHHALLAQVPVRVVLNPKASRLGAAHAARELLHRGREKAGAPRRPK